MKAILFGSIGTLLETSEIQRAAYNDAFKQHGLDWNWSQSEYADLLKQSGGKQRVAAYAESRGEDVDVDGIHQTKSQRFRELMNEGNMQPRQTVEALITRAIADDVRLALVTTTSNENVMAVLQVLPGPCRDAFEVVICRDDVDKAKPAGQAYELALQRLNLRGSECVAIEDNVDGVHAAFQANVQCVAFPGQNTAEHDFSEAIMVTDKLDFNQLDSITHAIV